MGLDTYDITITAAKAVTVTAVLCSAPTYSVSSVRLVAQPAFRDVTYINGVTLFPGDSLISATGGTVQSASPFIVQGATTAASSIVTITGTYSSAATSATFVIPFGTTFNAATKEYQSGGSPRAYGYTASFVSVSGGVTAVAEKIVGGGILVNIEYPPRVPTVPSSTNKACFVTQS